MSKYKTHVSAFLKQDHLGMNVALDQTILGLHIFLDHRSLSSIDQRSSGCPLSLIHRLLPYYLSVFLFFFVFFVSISMLHLKGPFINLTSCFHMLNFVFFRGVVSFILIAGA